MADLDRGPHGVGADVVAVGRVVTVDLGEGPERFLMGYVDEMAEGIQVITPHSPLGRALLGVGSGTEIEYSPQQHITARVRVTAVE